jgi:uncharacterized protein (DUF1330 family)
MVQLLVNMKVRDFNQWKQGYEKGSEMRKGAGSKGSRIFRDTSDHNHVVVLIDFEDAGRARTFFQSPDLAARQQEAGVIGRPETIFLEENTALDT